MAVVGGGEDKKEMWVWDKNTEKCKFAGFKRGGNSTWPEECGHSLEAGKDRETFSLRATRKEYKPFWNLDSIPMWHMSDNWPAEL